MRFFWLRKHIEQLTIIYNSAWEATFACSLKNLYEGIEWLHIWYRPRSSSSPTKGTAAAPSHRALSCQSTLPITSQWCCLSSITVLWWDHWKSWLCLSKSSRKRTASGGCLIQQHDEINRGSMKSFDHTWLVLIYPQINIEKTNQCPEDEYFEVKKPMSDNLPNPIFCNLLHLQDDRTTKAWGYLFLKGEESTFGGLSQLLQFLQFPPPPRQVHCGRVVCTKHVSLREDRHMWSFLVSIERWTAEWYLALFILMLCWWYKNVSLWFHFTQKK